MPWKGIPKAGKHLGKDSAGNCFFLMPAPYRGSIYVFESTPPVQSRWKIFDLPEHVVSELAALKLEGSI